MILPHRSAIASRRHTRTALGPSSRRSWATSRSSTAQPASSVTAGAWWA
jgi:hypothetical protein